MMLVKTLLSNVTSHKSLYKQPKKYENLLNLMSNCGNYTQITM